MTHPPERPAVISPPIAIETAGIGDIHSNERGSGARFNAGKPDLALLPLWLLAERCGPYTYGPDAERARLVLECLGQYQATHDCMPLDQAIAIMGRHAWEEAARVFSYGKEKYAAWNWAKGMPWSVPLACAVRHLVEIIDGEQRDLDKPGAPGSGLPLGGHVMCNLIMLRQYADTYPEGNDLPPLGALAPAPADLTWPTVPAADSTAVRRLLRLVEGF